ncbi:MAG: prephenate dehydratase [Nitrospira bacterium SM23_35]|jgi:chorismate mutase/prephenate dehydratase|nr:MAG: prephenate dehydratase [Nitrospira bacterium SM23_35]
MHNVEKLRKEIDKIDDEILNLLNKRSNIVLEIAHVKRNENAKFYSPERERQILERLTDLNQGPFPNETLKVIYREILSASLSLEEPLKVACLGPLATFTHLAALRHFGSSAQFMPVESIKDVFDVVETAKADFGVVPIENSNEGVISYTLDMFIDSELRVSAEVMLEITHNLLSLSGDKSKIKKVYSFSPATAQCRRWIQQNLAGIPIVEATSTARAAERASADPEAAAIASDLAAEIYNLQFIEKNIEDSRQNYTRFLVISKEFPQQSGHDKTSIMFTLKNKPGSLYKTLEPFKKADINLTKIESRPSKRKAWEYIFFADMEGHIENKKLRKAIDAVKDNCLFLKILGSYPYGGL